MHRRSAISAISSPAAQGHVATFRGCVSQTFNWQPSDHKQLHQAFSEVQLGIKLFSAKLARYRHQLLYPCVVRRGWRTSTIAVS